MVSVSSSFSRKVQKHDRLIICQKCWLEGSEFDTPSSCSVQELCIGNVWERTLLLVRAASSAAVWQQDFVDVDLTAGGKRLQSDWQHRGRLTASATGEPDLHSGHILHSISSHVRLDKPKHLTFDTLNNKSDRILTLCLFLFIFTPKKPLTPSHFFIPI